MMQLPDHRKYHLKYQGIFCFTSTAGRVDRDRGLFIVTRCLLTDCYCQATVIHQPGAFGVEKHLQIKMCIPLLPMLPDSSSQPYTARPWRRSNPYNLYFILFFIIALNNCIHTVSTKPNTQKYLKMGTPDLNPPCPPIS